MRSFENFDLKKISTFKIGGTCELLCIIRDQNDLLKALKEAKHRQLPIYIHGGGSNVVFEETHFQKAFLWMQNKHIQETESELQVEAGCSWVELQRYCSENDITGLEPLMTIPGTIGGAAYGNAGAFGMETLAMVNSVETINLETHKLQKIDITDQYYSYRYSKLQKIPNSLIWKVNFAKNKMSEVHDLPAIKEKRDSSQPKGLTTGSFFKNPPNDYAGRLIEACGLKGFQLGGAMISEKHANFFMNVEQASFDDIQNLAKLAQDKVFEKFCVKLEKEVHFVFAKD